MAHDDTNSAVPAVREKRGPAFTAEQHQELLSLGLFPEQVKQLENDALTAISWRLRPPPPLAEVRETLSTYAKTLDHAKEVHVRIFTPKARASAEVITRLDEAHEALGLSFLSFEEQDQLLESLNAMSSIAHRALQDVRKGRRWGMRRNDPRLVRLILWALQRGHVEHFDCSGYGDLDVRTRQPMPAFEIEVTRNAASVFPRIVEIVAEASGGWSTDDAIKSYLKWDRDQKRAREERPKPGKLIVQ